MVEKIIFGARNPSAGFWFLVRLWLKRSFSAPEILALDFNFLSVHVWKYRLWCALFQNNNNFKLLEDKVQILLAPGWNARRFQQRITCSLSTSNAAKTNESRTSTCPLQGLRLISYKTRSTFSWKSIEVRLSPQLHHLEQSPKGKPFLLYFFIVLPISLSYLATFKFSLYYSDILTLCAFISKLTMWKLKVKKHLIILLFVM